MFNRLKNGQYLISGPREGVLSITEKIIYIAIMIDDVIYAAEVKPDGDIEFIKNVLSELKSKAGQ